MPTVYARWILVIIHRFGNNLPKMCSFASFNRPKLDICSNLQKKHCSGEQNISVVMELLNNGHRTHHMDLGDFSQIWK